MGLWGSITGAVTDVVGDVGGAIADVADAAAHGAAHVADTASDVVGGAATVINTATGGLAEDALELVDDVVLDAVDTATGGLVDLDYDDGRFTVDVGVDGVANVGAEISQSGVRVESESLLHEQAIGLTDDGLDVQVAAGIDGISDHLPYGSLDMDLDTDGDIALDAEAHGTIPTPYGIVSGRGEAKVIQNEDGTLVHVDADGQIILVDGDVVRGDLGIGYIGTDDGSQLSVNAGASYTSASGVTIGGQVGYGRVELPDGTVIEATETSLTGGYRGITHTVGDQTVAVEPGTGVSVPGQPPVPNGAPGDGSATPMILTAPTPGLSAPPDPTSVPVVDPTTGAPATAEPFAPIEPFATEPAPFAPAEPIIATEPAPSLSATAESTDRMANELMDKLFADDL